MTHTDAYFAFWACLFRLWCLCGLRLLAADLLLNIDHSSSHSQSIIPLLPTYFIMPPVLFPLATTTQINFSNLLIDPSSSYTGVLAQATSARTKVFLALQAVAEHQPGANALAIVDVRTQRV